MTSLEEIYFGWLCAKVLDQPSFNHNYHKLLEILFRTEFVWSIDGDHNRAADGCELRTFFLVELQMDADPMFKEHPCSVLEMLIGLAQRASFQTGQPTADWFRTFLVNLGLDDYRCVDHYDENAIQTTLRYFMERRYASNGEGGLFPLSEPVRDQRNIELWYQLCDYIYDQGLI